MKVEFTAKLKIGDRVVWNNDTKTESVEGVVVSDEVDPDGAYPIVWATDTNHVGGCLPEECSLVARAVYMTPERILALESAANLREYRLQSMTFKPGIAEEEALLAPLRAMLEEAN